MLLNKNATSEMMNFNVAYFKKYAFLEKQDRRYSDPKARNG